MIYIIKFIYSFVLPPGLFVVLLSGMTIWLWRKNRRPAVVLLGITVLLYLSMTSLVSDALVGSLERKYEQPARIRGDVIVVLGGGASSGTPDIDGEGNMFGHAANRLLTAARLYRETGIPVLFSGGQVFADSGNEANIAKRQLIGLGIPEADILVENESLNTEQNAVNTAEVMRENGLSRPVLVTSAFHMARAMEEFGAAGLTPLAYPTDYIASRGASFHSGKFSPSPGAASTTGTALKEYLGLLAARF
ncbi:YdcF family protein [Paenibacillus sp. PK3_47]|uniref:YdcF family protein n=1 Tax=Paenibacillus sp. PK3_47 TaxID=2072642 RepID=UPI00201E1F5B|nr:YdcF family protein [Paenibacillus sp. PK3_47]UQZ37755.1 YdcF family protein [Paenibacillus sp. PK3_47]